jgi:tRNA pseudouridine38-40 synthase
MSRYFITFSYDGTAYHGWQIQPHSISVQEQLQKALSTLLRQSIEIVGAGRTDTGVHARKMVAHFDFGELDCSQLVYKLNKMLPKDIAVYKVEQVSEDMHARFSAKSRTYHYFLHLSKDPFLRVYSWQMYGDLDFDLMNKAALVLMEYRDFTSFSKVNTDTKTNDCTITEAHWDRVGDNQWRFTISANRFLRNMVRAIVGTLVEVGRGKLTIEQLRQVIEAKDRCRAGDSVPGNALFLVEVLY